MKKVVLTLALLGIFSGTALASNNATQAKPVKKQAVTKMTCEEFLLLDESYFPVVVGINVSSTKEPQFDCIAVPLWKTFTLTLLLLKVHDKCSSAYRPWSIS